MLHCRCAALPAFLFPSPSCCAATLLAEPSHIGCPPLAVPPCLWLSSPTCRGLQRFMSTAVLYFCNLLVGLSVLVNLMVNGWLGGWPIG